jgi:hypothetical protein
MGDPIAVGKNDRPAVFEFELYRLVVHRDAVADLCGTVNRSAEAGIDYEPIGTPGERLRDRARRFDRADADGQHVDAIACFPRRQLFIDCPGE